MQDRRSKKQKETEGDERNPVGQPALFLSVKQLQDQIDSYFDQPETKFTISGLAYHLGFQSRQSFYDYEKDDKFAYTIKRAHLRIEVSYEERLHGTTPTGSIFALKNLGWEDKTKAEIVGDLIDKLKIGFE